MPSARRWAACWPEPEAEPEPEPEPEPDPDPNPNPNQVGGLLAGLSADDKAKLLASL